LITNVRQSGGEKRTELPRVFDAEEEVEKSAVQPRRNGKRGRGEGRGETRVIASDSQQSAIVTAESALGMAVNELRFCLPSEPAHSDLARDRGGISPPRPSSPHWDRSPEQEPPELENEHSPPMKGEEQRSRKRRGRCRCRRCRGGSRRGRGWAGGEYKTALGDEQPIRFNSKSRNSLRSLEEAGNSRVRRTHRAIAPETTRDDQASHTRGPDCEGMLPGIP
jgi:hypothetical protein